MDILILTGKFGMGHYSAASSLVQQIQAVNPEAELMLEDIFDYAMPEYSDTVYKAFGFMVKRGSKFYNSYYNRLEMKGSDLKPVFLSYFLKKLILLLEEKNPDAIISTLPFCSQIVSRYKEHTGSTIPLITCITDISSHSEWINMNTDCYLVPSKSVRRSLMHKGVFGHEIYVYGIPVRPEFDIEKQNLTKCEKHILIMGGGLGMLPKSTEFYHSLNSSGKFKITVITGKNHEIYEKLYGRYENITVVGYTDEVYRYMQDADVVISKPGGITLFETIRSETPMLVFEPFLQQEINNTGFIINNGIGIILKKHPKHCLQEITNIVNDDVLMTHMKHNVKRLKNEYNHQTIAAVLSHIK